MPSAVHTEVVAIHRESLRPAFRWFLLGQGLLHEVFPVALELQSVCFRAWSGLFLRMVRVVHRLLSFHES